MPRDGLEGAQRVKGRQPVEEAHRLVFLSYARSRNDSLHRTKSLILANEANARPRKVH
jgi:hypothetical protein